MTRTRVPMMFLLPLLLLFREPLHAQYPLGSPPLDHPSVAPGDNTAARLEVMSQMLLRTQTQLEETQQQLKQLSQELEQLRGNGVSVSTALSPAAASSSLAEQVSRQQEELEVLRAQVKQHDQIKLETVSKYPVRLYGLMLFNAYSNAGVVDNADLPSVAIPRQPDASHGSVGATLRQTIFGLSGTGPRLLGAQSSADISLDLFGGQSYSYYSTANGSVHLRRADIRLAWGASAAEASRNELRVGIDTPLISPLSPTSFATVAEPSLAWSGNLWTWAPQVQFKHTFSLSSFDESKTLQLQGGLWDPPVVGVATSSASHVLSPGELSRRPGFLGRASFHTGSGDHASSFGIGGYSDRQTYDDQSIEMWAATGDWQIPVGRRLQLTGEIYRGRGLGNLGGGAYKDVLMGTDKITGAQSYVGLNAAGGWAQLKANLFPGGEANVSFGLDGGFAGDFRRLNLSNNAYILEQSARNHMTVANFIYRPKTYLILSPEYRRIWSWKTYGHAATADVYTLSLGYEF